MSAASKIDVSVVIVTYNSRDVVGRGIESVRAHTHDVTYEIIVVDNASPDDSGAYVVKHYPGVRVLHLPTNNRGLSAAINAGVAASSGTYVMQWNPDCRLEEDSLSTLATYLGEHADVGIAAPKLLNEDGSLQLSCRAFPGYMTALFSRYSLLTRVWPGNPFSTRYLMTGFDHSDAADVDWASGAGFMYRRSLHERLGGWDEGFFLFNEDVDLCKRVHEAGLRVVYAPDARVYHAIGISERPSTRAIVERHRSMWRYYRKHVRRVWVTDVITAPVILVRCVFALGRRLISLQRRRAGLRGSL